VPERVAAFAAAMASCSQRDDAPPTAPLPRLLVAFVAAQLQVGLTALFYSVFVVFVSVFVSVLVCMWGCARVFFCRAVALRLSRAHARASTHTTTSALNTRRPGMFKSIVTHNDGGAVRSAPLPDYKN
jgi:heme A synthase